MPELEGSPPPPSFAGKLELNSFMFKAATTAPQVRRSPRLGRPFAVPSPASPSSRQPISRSVTPSKRKLPPGGSEDDLAATEDGSVEPSLATTPSRPRTLAVAASASPSPSPSSSAAKKKKRARPKSGYAPPSTYAHLPELADVVAPGLLVLFVGLNPGIETARQGHAYAHPSNLFWKLLCSSGLTAGRLLRPEEDGSLPARFALGNTNIVTRPSRNGAELSKGEMDAGVAALEAKARRWRPEVVCLVGKSIWESVWRVRHGRAITKEQFRYGWQDEAENMGVVGGGGQRDDEREEGVDYGDGGSWAGARVFVATSTSGLAASLRPAEKEKIWRELGAWAEQRREERAAAAAAAAAAST